MKSGRQHGVLLSEHLSKLGRLRGAGGGVVGGVGGVVGGGVGGGVGGVGGVVAGVIIFNIMSYGLTFIGLSPYWQYVAKGVIIIAAVAIDVRKYAKKN